MEERENQLVIAEKQLEEAVENYSKAGGQYLVVYGEEGFTSSLVNGKCIEIISKLLTAMNADEDIQVIVTAATKLAEVKNR